MTLIVGGNLLRGKFEDHKFTFIYLFSWSCLIRFAGLKGSGISLQLVFGIVAVRYVFLPVAGILMVKGAVYLGLVHADPLYVFVLLLQFAVPPAINTGMSFRWQYKTVFPKIWARFLKIVNMAGTIMQLFGVGESECSVIMLWTYGLASISLTLWSTFFMWLVA